ncbi:hypothetical protein NK6_1906 [Bradyrhizobium diazoefficiens]|uniref:Uncharacterized protein n=1 Tax=Bradyrhizobium diazoefficiens TaxID=1355477 RepID=A0A0E4BLB9_9BRAD|nr:hypothetical protein NK6_1906 [Bradyrhizobium diazoefficiens]
MGLFSTFYVPALHRRTKSPRLSHSRAEKFSLHHRGRLKD